MYSIEDLLGKGDDFAGFPISCDANLFFSLGAIFEYFAETQKSSLPCYVMITRYPLM
jgi:hypothetical protein